MKKISLFILAIMVLGLGCTTDPVQNENIDAIQDPVITSEQYLEPMMHYNQTFDVAEFEKNFEATDVNLRTRTRFLFLRTNGTQSILTPGDANYSCDGLPQVVLVGEGRGWPVGEYDFNGGYCLNPLDGSPASPILGTLTTNNGLLYSEMLSASEAPNQYGYWEQVWKFYDGTGIYEGACGWVKFYVTLDFVNETWENRGFGLIRY